MLAIWKREVRAYFTNVTGWIFIGAFLFCLICIFMFIISATDIPMWHILYPALPLFS